MKNLILKIVLLLLLSSNLVYSQIDDLYHAKIFNKCELTYLDGKVVNGFIAFFCEQKSFDDEDAYGSSIERLFNLDDNDFEFKESINDNFKNLTQKDLKSIKVFHQNNYTKTYKLMNIKSFDRFGKIIPTSKRAWLPVVKDDEISLYQFNVYKDIQKYDRKTKDYVSKKLKYSFALTYLSNEKQDIAFEIYNSEFGRFSTPTLNDAYLGKVLNYIFQDCPTFLNKIMKDKKWDYKPFEDKSIDYQDKIREIKNSNLDDYDKFNQIDEIYTQKEAQPLLKLIEEYNLNCK